MHPEVLGAGPCSCPLVDQITEAAARTGVVQDGARDAAAGEAVGDEPFCRGA